MRGWLVLGLAAAATAYGYPLDGAARTGIRRLVGYRLQQEGTLQGPKLPPGALLSSNAIVLRLRGVNDGFDLGEKSPHDPYLQAGLEKIFAARDPSYAAALLDISDPQRPLYASLRADRKMIPGSVGKLLVAAGLFDALARTYPASVEAREKLLRETIVPADSFIFRDSKTVPVYGEGGAGMRHRRLALGDKFNLWEWLDHMLSVSSNAAGSMVWKQALLLRRFGARYPLPLAEEAAFLRGVPKPELSKLALETLEAPLTAAGLDTARLRLGTMFTSNASAAIPGTASYASPNELLRWLVKLEQGKLVDAWSSLELKKLLYFVRPRYRYASSPALRRAAVFFKSGSLFECTPEPGFTCAAYQGNKRNLMHSVAVVESERKVYLVAIMSNVLRVNSAVEHHAIAGEIERLIQARPQT
jgi:hypothetical protein